MAPPTITAVGVSPSTASLQGVGATAALAASITPASATAAITWRSSSASVATVSGSGASATVTAVGAGTATVTATADGVNGTATITVVPIVRAINAPATAAVVVGSTVQPAVTVTADAGASGALQYTSSAQQVAVVSNAGVITGVAPGTATITIASVAFPAITAQVAVTVSLPVVRSVVVTPANAALFVGQAQPLAAAVDVDGGTSTAVTWMSGATTIASVNGAGVVTALAPGTAVITATSVANPAVSGTATVVVSTPTVRTITLTPPAPLIVLGQAQLITPTLDADPGANQAVTWSVANANIATVDAGGLVTAVSNGSTTLTAQSVLVPAVQATITVTVIDAPPFVAWTQPPVSPPYSGLNRTVESAFGTSGGTWWATQDDAPLMRFSGGAWQASSVTFPDRVTTLSGSGATMWVLLDDGRLFRTDDADAVAPGFVEEALPGAPDIEAIWAVSPTRVVAVATSRVFVRDGTWSELTMPGITTIRSVGASALDDIVIGTLGGPAPYLRRWNGTTWGDLPALPVAGNVQEVLVTDADVIVRATGGGQHVLNGPGWTTLSHPASSPALNETVFDVEHCGGMTYGITLRGARVYRRVAGTWSLFADYGVALPSSASGRLACGSDGVLRALGPNGAIARAGGSGWTWEHQATRFTALSLVRPDLAYAAGASGQIYRWNGTTWSPELTGAVLAFQSISATPDGMVVAGTLPTAGGVGPSIYQKINGGSWTSYSPPGQCRAVWAASRQFALAAGDACSQRWNGTNWTAAPALAGVINTIDGSSPDFAMAVGLDGLSGVSYTWNGTTWQSVPVPPGIVFNFVRVHSPSLAYAIASNAKLYRWTGGNWDEVVLPGALALLQVQSVSINSPTDVYAIGRGGEVLRFDGQAWQHLHTIASLLGEALDAASGRPSLDTQPGYGIISSTWGALFHANSLPGASVRRVRR